MIIKTTTVRRERLHNLEARPSREVEADTSSRRSRQIQNRCQTAQLFVTGAVPFHSPHCLPARSLPAEVTSQRQSMWGSVAPWAAASCLGRAGG